MMAQFGNVRKIRIDVGGRFYTFRSKLEYRWAQWCQLRKEQGIIEDWFYEADEVKVETKKGEVWIYRPDFTIEYEDRYEFEETKGWFRSKDKTKMKLMAEQYDNPVTLIFSNLVCTKSKRLQYSRAKSLEKLLESNGGRVIYHANRDIFRKIGV